MITSTKDLITTTTQPEKTDTHLTPTGDVRPSQSSYCSNDV